MKLPNHVSESIKRRNPELFGVGAVASNERKQSQDKPLVKSPRPQRSRKGRVEFVVSIIACRPRVLDDDNSAAGGTKAIRDAISKSLGLDDGDARIKFQYGQLQTASETGCIVKLEHLL